MYMVMQNPYRCRIYLNFPFLFLKRYIHYEQKGENGPPLLLVPGFGVGVFHYRRNIEELSKDHRVYALDLLGQGRSWPTERRAEDELCYSIDTW